MRKASSGKKITAVFFQTSSENEPVKDELKKLGRPVKTDVGESIRYVELNWKVGEPTVKTLRPAKKTNDETIYEVRTKSDEKQYRTTFFVHAKQMILVHFFLKKTQKTPKRHIELSVDRMREWISGLE